MALSRRMAALAGGLSLSACGPSVALEGSDTDATTSGESTASAPTPTASSPMPSPDATSTPESTAAPDGDDGEDGDTCLGECGVECFADDECGPGGYCRDDNTCGTLPQLEPCASGAILGEPGIAVAAASAIDDVALGDLEGDGDLDIVALRSETAELLVLRNDGDGVVDVDSTIGLLQPAMRLALGDDDDDGLLEAFAIRDFDVRRLPGDASTVFGPDSHYTSIDLPTTIATAYVDDDAFADLVIAAHLFQPRIDAVLSNGMGMPAEYASTPLEEQGGIGGRFAFAARPAGGATGVIAGSGAARRFRSMPDGAFDEGNRLQVTNTFTNAIVADVSVVAWGNDDGERVGAIANVLDYTFLSVADFESGAAFAEDRFGLPEPSVRVEVAWDAAFDVVVATAAGAVYAVRVGEACFEAHELGLAVAEIAIGDVTGDGIADVVLAADLGLFVLVGVG